MQRRILFFLLPALAAGFAATNNSKSPPQQPKQQQQQRQPWEVGRFIRQSSKFVNLPFAPSSNNSNNNKKTTIQPGDVVWPSSPSSSIQFGPLDDVVMGGASSSNFDNASGIWKGRVTEANNGGFIGIRSYPTQNWDMSKCTGIELTLKQPPGRSTTTTTTTTSTDKRFKVVVRDSTDFNGICWTTSVNVAGGSSQNPLLKLFDNKKEDDGMITTVKVPFKKQIPTLFAKTVPDATFNPENVVGLQLAYSKFEYDGALNPKFEAGDVELQILEIKAY